MTTATNWTLVISVIVFALAAGVLFEAKTSQGLASENGLPRGPSNLNSGAVAQSPVGTAFTHQGRLNYRGAPANSGFDFTFELFNIAEGGSPIADVIEMHDFAVADGLFTVQIDFGDDAFHAKPQQIVQAHEKSHSIRPRPLVHDRPGVFCHLDVGSIHKSALLHH